MVSMLNYFMVLSIVCHIHPNKQNYVYINNFSDKETSLEIDIHSDRLYDYFVQDLFNHELVGFIPSSTVIVNYSQS